MPVEQPSNVYREQLSSLYHGLALWKPNPVDGVYDQVSIGDVGYISDGAFIRMFNVTLSWDDESNKALGEPYHYDTLRLNDFAISRERFGQIDYYSRGVDKEENAGNMQAFSPDQAEGVTYKCRGRGALLSLPRGGLRQDVIHRKVFEGYIGKNVSSWFNWSKERRLPVECMEDLVLVYGCTLVTSWAAAAFDDYARDAQVSLANRTLDHGGASFVWRNTRGTVEYHDSQLDSNIYAPQNRCVFIKCLRAKRVLFWTRHLRGAAEPLPDDPDNSQEDKIQVTQAPDVSRYCDPLTGVLDYIVEKCLEDATDEDDIEREDMAITHHDDLQLINDSNMEVITTDAVLQFLRENDMPLHSVNGATMLRHHLRQVNEQEEFDKSPGTGHGASTGSTTANRGSDAFNFSSRPTAKMQMPIELVPARTPSDTQRFNRDDTGDRSTVNPDNIDGSDVLLRPTSRRQFRLDVLPPRLHFKRWIRRLIGYLRPDSHGGTECRDDQSTSTVDLQTQPHIGLPSPREGTTDYNLCKSAQSYFETYTSEGDSMDPEERRQEHLAMETTNGCMSRDLRAFRWLVDNINGSDEMADFVPAIPGSFDEEWGREVWKEVVGNQSTPTPIQTTTVSTLSKSAQSYFETYSNEGDSMDPEERHQEHLAMKKTDGPLVGKVVRQLSALGEKERTNDPSTINSFTVRWTCLSLVAIREVIGDDSRIQELAKFALDGIKYSRHDYVVSTVALADAQRIDNYLKKAWAPVVDLYLEFEPRSQDMTEIETKRILNNCEASISALERIAIEADGVENIDWRISLLQKAMDEVTQKLMRHLPGVSFSELKPVTPIVISEAFDFSSFESTPITPQLIFLGQQIQSLCALGQGLRDIIEDRNPEMHEGTLKSLKSLREIPVAVRGLNHLMKRQIWRLLDLRDGGGLGFTIELFFLAVRQLSSTSLLDELKEDLYTGTFTTITSNWEKSKNLVGTQRVLLDLLCDLVISRRGVFSDFAYPSYIVDMLLNVVGKMVKGHGGRHAAHINDVIQELENENFRNCKDNDLRGRALDAIGQSSEDPNSNFGHPSRGLFVWSELAAGSGGQGFAEGST